MGDRCSPHLAIPFGDVSTMASGTGVDHEMASIYLAIYYTAYLRNLIRKPDFVNFIIGYVDIPVTISNNKY